MTNEDNKNTIIITIKISIMHFILITLVAYIAIGTTVLKTPGTSHFWPKIQFPIAIYTTSVFKFQIQKIWASSEP